MNLIIKSCEKCGKKVEIKAYRDKTFRFCSLSCHAKTVFTSETQKKIKRRKGAANNNWKGGYRKHSNGYRWKLVKGKYILEHRYIMEQFLGRKLTFNENVHHINGNKLDNKIENLEVLSRAQHTKLHNPRLGTGKY